MRQRVVLGLLVLGGAIGTGAIVAPILDTPSSGSDVPTEARALLAQGWAKVQQASLYAKWKAQNPGESSKLEAYWLNGGTAPVLATLFGQSEVLDAQAYYVLAEPPPPPPTVTEPPPPPAGAANVWVSSAAGASPSRCSPACAFDPARAFGSLDAANDVCQAGDSVLIRSGTVLAGQNVSGSNGRTAACVMRPESGVVRVNGDVSLGAPGGDGPDWLTIQNVQCGDPGSYLNESELFVWDGSQNVVLDGWDCASFDIFSDGGVTIKDGDWGPCGSSATRKCVPRAARSNVTLVGNRFHDIACGNGSDSQCGSYHTDGLAIFGGANVSVLRNSFYRNDIVNIRFQTCCGNTPLSNLRVEGNWFGPVCVTGSTTWTPCGLGIRSGAFDVDVPIPGLVVRGNSFSNGGNITVQSTLGTSASPAQIVGNAMTQTDNCGGNAVYQSNAYVPFSENNGLNGCGSSDVRVSGMGYVSESVAGIDYHIGAGSPLVGLVSCGLLPAVDFDGQARPASGMCAAGSDER